MFSNVKVKIPTIKGKIYRSVNKGIPYIQYEYDRVYFPDKKYNVPKRTTIGKQCEDDPEMMFPNSNLLKYLPDYEMPEALEDSVRSSCLHLGAYAVIKKIIKDYKLDETLEEIIGKDSGLFLDLVAYSIVTENNAAQYYPDYAYNHPLFTEEMKILSDSKISKFLKEISVDQRVEFLNKWNESRDHREKIYISYDSTNKSCQAGDIDVAEFGYAKDGQDKPLINFSIAYDKNNCEPLFYEDYPGSIVDVSQLQNMLEKARGYGYKKAGFILDRGYFSRENIRYMDKCNYDFIIMVKGKKKLVNELVLKKKGKFEDFRENAISEYDVRGITVRSKLFPSDKSERYFHIYFSDQKHATEATAFDAKINTMAEALKKQQDKPVIIGKSFEKYFDIIYYHKGKEDQLFSCGRELYDVTNKERSLCGYFVIISSKKMTAREALTLYKSRDASEKLFKTDKSYLGNKSIRVQSSEALKTKIFIEFVALIIRNKIYTNIKDEMIRVEKKANYMTVPAALKELEKIEMIRRFNNSYTLDHAVTAKQKAILKAFGMDIRHIKACADKVEGALRLGRK